MSRVVEFVRMRSRLAVDNQATFCFRPDRPARWLQRACFYVLRKLRAFQESYDIERVRIDAPTFMERLFAQMDDLEGTFNLRPTRLLIGAEDYGALMNEIAISSPLSFSAEYFIDRSVMGMTVHIIPWMRGCVVLTDEVLKSPRAPYGGMA